MKQKYSVINRLEMMGYDVEIIEGGILVYFRSKDFEYVKMMKNEELETKFVIESYVLEINNVVKELIENEGM